MFAAPTICCLITIDMERICLAVHIPSRLPLSVVFCVIPHQVRCIYSTYLNVVDLCRMCCICTECWRHTMLAKEWHPGAEWESKLVHWPCLLGLISQVWPRTSPIGSLFDFLTQASLLDREKTSEVHFQLFTILRTKLVSMWDQMATTSNWCCNELLLKTQTVLVWF